MVSFLSVASEYLPLSPHLVQLFIRTILSLRVGDEANKSNDTGENNEEDDEDGDDNEMAVFVSRVLGHLERRFQILFDSVLSSELLK